ncbi:hypothetical protein GIB67_031224 [Kingdonia uniflora]|uniref:Uncharacterized protein n=1 Tax=Kingdonia uniflora TaxID=39325 RepID=A0A7J7NK63_9MAGN|nr:hypothetical protein GIB67_031224 [Kingdonia uniflora]
MLVMHRTQSDHLLILGEYNQVPKPSNIPFRYLQSWGEEPGLGDIVTESWGKPMYVAPLFFIMLKLQRLKADIKIWRKASDAHKKNKTTLESEVMSLQLQLEDDFTNDLIKKRYLAKTKLLNRWEETEEMDWRQKSRIKWLLAGDRNTSFFHSTTNARNAKALITEIINSTGRVITSLTLIQEHIINYYTSKFSAKDTQHCSTHFEQLPKRVQGEENTILTSCPINEEIKETVFSMDNNSTTGPDGFYGAFYQKYWEILCADIYFGISSFFLDGIKSLGEVNNAILCKLHWVFKQGTEEWAKYLISKFSTKSGDPIRYHKISTLWAGIKIGVALSKTYIGWPIGDGTKIDFWKDTWAIDIPLIEYIDLPTHMWKKCKAKLSNFINSQG